MTARERQVPLERIVIGERHRQDLGDIRALALSIRANGLLQSIGVTADNRLVFGHRRVAAARFLGWTSIAAREVDIESLVRAEKAENFDRKAFTMTELVAISAAIAAEERAAAAARMQAGKAADAPAQPAVSDSPTPSGKFRPQVTHERAAAPPAGPAAKRAAGESRNQIAIGLGVSGRTLEKATQLVAAAEKDPAVKPLVEAMDKTGKVNGPYRRWKVAQAVADMEAKPPPMPHGPFAVLVVDPPWPYEVGAAAPARDRATYPYPQMSLAQIRGMQLPAADDAVLWLWSTNYPGHLREAFDIAAHWGFQVRTVLTWAKDQAGQGHWLRGQTEQCLLCTRGKPVIRPGSESTHLPAPVDHANHSKKPDAFFQLVERMCPGSKIEIFQRGSRPGWHGFGDQAVAQAAAVDAPVLIKAPPPRPDEDGMEIPAGLRRVAGEAVPS